MIYHNRFENGKHWISCWFKEQKQTFFIRTGPYAYFGVVGGIGPSGILRYFRGKIQQGKKNRLAVSTWNWNFLPCRSYHFDHFSNGKVFLCEVSCFCERCIVVVTGGLRVVGCIGTLGTRENRTNKHLLLLRVPTSQTTPVLTVEVTEIRSSYEHVPVRSHMTLNIC